MSLVGPVGMWVCGKVRIMALALTPTIDLWVSKANFIAWTLWVGRIMSDIGVPTVEKELLQGLKM